MQFCIFEDARHINFQPLVHFRPVYDLRCGALSLREKIALCIPSPSVVLQCRSGIADLSELEFSSQAVNALLEHDTWFINGRLLADESLSQLLRSKKPEETSYYIDGELAIAFVRRGRVLHFANQLVTEYPPNDSDVASPTLNGRLMKYPWDLVHHTSEEIENDFHRLKARRTNRVTSAKSVKEKISGAHLLNKKNIVIGKGTVVKPGAVLDAENGPIILGNGVLVMSNAVIQGPAYIGDQSIIKIGAKIYHGSSIGAHCKVGGEVEASVIQSYSNKQHEGFLGHSYLGSWVNLGADTNTSDLKNTYGTIRVQVNGTSIDSGMQFVGLTMGDHSKSGINVMFDTGTVVGSSCNIYGAGLPPKFVPSFTWGGEGKYTEYHLEKSLETARRMMSRRNVLMTPAYEKVFREVFVKSERERRVAGIGIA